MESQAGKKKSKSKKRKQSKNAYRNYQPPSVGPHWGGKATGFADATFTGEINSTGNIGLACVVPMGPGSNQRIGRKIAWKSFFLRGSFSAKASATANKIAILLVYDKQVTQGTPPTNVLPAITDILSAASPSALNNPQNLSRFRIMMRKDFVVFGGVPTTLPDTNGNLTTTCGYLLDEMVDLRMKPAEFKSVSTGDGSIGDYVSGALYFVIIGSQPTGAGACDITVNARTRFVDVQG